MGACIDRTGNYTQVYLAQMHTPTPSPPPPEIPTSTANPPPKPCHNRKRATQQSGEPLHFISHRKVKRETIRDKKALQSITAHGTALSRRHWHLGERLAEEEEVCGVGGLRVGRYAPSHPPLMSKHCGHRLMISWQQRATEAWKVGSDCQ